MSLNFIQSVLFLPVSLLLPFLLFSFFVDGFKNMNSKMNLLIVFFVSYFSSSRSHFPVFFLLLFFPLILNHDPFFTTNSLIL